MKKILKTLWVMVLAIFILLFVAIPFGVNGSLFAYLLGYYIIAPLFLIQIVVWIFFRNKTSSN